MAGTPTEELRSEDLTGKDFQYFEKAVSCTVAASAEKFNCLKPFFMLSVSSE